MSPARFRSEESRSVPSVSSIHIGSKTPTTMPQNAHSERDRL
jgi:hypothetical protein